MDAPPSNIGRYLVKDRIGQGGMGILYLALDPAIDRLVALKVLRIDNDELRQRFEREARAIGRFQHPNIVSIYDVGVHEGRPFIAMEYVPGETVGEKFLRRQTLPLLKRLKLVEELCDGLAYAHQHGIVHRDIKPPNLMIHRDTGRLKILDFGIARAARDTAITQLGARVGTPSYMAPEQIQGGVVDHRTDIFAVGLVLYEMLAYRRAFPGDESHHVVYRILNEAPAPLQQFDPNVEPELVSLVERAIDKQPARRYQSLVDLQRDLARLRQSLAERRLDSTVVLVPPAGDEGESTPHRQVDRMEVLRKREEQIAAQLAAAKEALARGDYEAALKAGEQAALLNPDDSRVAEILKPLDSMAADRQTAEHIDASRRHLEAGELTQALDRADHALRLKPDDNRAAELRNDVEQAHGEHEREREREQAVSRALDQARSSLASGALEAAHRALNEVFAYEPEHLEGRVLKQQAERRAEARERHAVHERDARDAVGRARAAFGAGSPEEALRLLTGFEPAHPLVSETLGELRAEHEAPTAAARTQYRAPRVSAIDDARAVPGPIPEATRWDRIRASRAALLLLGSVSVVVGIVWIVVANRPVDFAPSEPSEILQNAPTPAVPPISPPPGDPNLAPVDTAPPPVPVAPPTEPPEPDDVAAEPALNLTVLFATASEALDGARYPEAAAAYGIILQLDPDNSDAQEGLERANAGAVRQQRIDDLVARGNLLLEQGNSRSDFAEALKAYDEALTINPQNATALDGRRRADAALRILGSPR